MRKAHIAFAILIVSLTLPLPAVALDLNISGSLQFEGVYNDKATSQKSDKPDSFREMRLRVLTEARVNDRIKLITRFDALDKVLSSRDSAFDENEDDDNIDLDRAYMEIVSPVGLFMVGRQKGVVWGTSWSDDEEDTDRIKYILPIKMGENKLYLAAVAEKVAENDKGVETSSNDNDKYYLAVTYVAKNFKTGLLGALYDFNVFQDPGQAVLTKAVTDAGGVEKGTADLTAAATAKADAESYGTKALAAQTDALAAQAAANSGTAAAAAAAAVIAAGGTAQEAENAANATTAQLIATAVAKGETAQIYKEFSENAVAKATAAGSTDAATSLLKLSSLDRGTTASAKVYLISPYFTGKFNNLGITAELDYIFGTAEYDDANKDTSDRDVSAYSWFGEATCDMGPLTFQAGYATVQGDAGSRDANGNDTSDINNMGYVGPGTDWAKMFILTGDEHGMESTLGGGLGNLVGTGFGTAAIATLEGYRMFYAGVDYKITDYLTIGTIIATSKADDTLSGVDDDHGVEYDANLTLKLMDNLIYSATAALLQAGDYWSERAARQGFEADGEDTYSLYHKLELFF